MWNASNSRQATSIPYRNAELLSFVGSVKLARIFMTCVKRLTTVQADLDKTGLVRSARDRTHSTPSPGVRGARLRGRLKTRLGFRLGVAPLPKTQTAEGHNPSLSAPHACLGASGYRRTPAGRVRPPGPLLGPGDGRHL